jgi:hypothetical protein
VREPARGSIALPRSSFYSGALKGSTMSFSRGQTHMCPHIPFECRTMLLSVASFLRVRSGGKGSPGYELIFSIAQIVDRIESRITGGGCQLHKRDQFRLEIAPDEGEASFVVP